MSRLIELAGVTAFYGRAQALFGIDLTLEKGEAVAILGRNGMGKTTSVKAITRLLPHANGTVTVMGQDVRGWRPHQVARLGIGLVPEGRRCFAPLTVWENAIAAARPGVWDWGRVCQLFPRLAERRDQLAGTLSGGEQQMLAIARALMTNPRVLILDEATEGLAPVIRAEIWQSLHTLRDEGQAILLIDKNLSELLTVIDRAVIFERGQTVWQGASSSLTAEITHRYLGI